MRHLHRQWFLVVLVLSLALGTSGAEHFQFLTRLSGLKWLVVSTTMILMSWPLPFAHVRQTVRKPHAAILASFLSLVVTPLAAWPLSRLFEHELGTGLIVAAAVPSTLASAAVWTRRAGGNDSTAILVTIITNSLCFVVTPMWVFALTGAPMQTAALVGTIYKLLAFVILPMIVGQLLRLHGRSGKWAYESRARFSVLAQVGVLFMVFLGALELGLRSRLSFGSGYAVNQITIVVVVVLSLHLGILAMGLVLSRLAGMSRGDQIAVGFSGSQKTLMVGLSTALSMGLNIIPIVAYHTVQLVVDTLIVDWFKYLDPQRDPDSPNEP